MATNETAQHLKSWASALGLGEHGMAALLGVPVFTYRKWENGTRSLDAAPRRLIDLLHRLETEAPELFTRLVVEAGAVGEPTRAIRAKRGPGKTKTPASAENAPSGPPAPAQPAPDAPSVPDWLKI